MVVLAGALAQVPGGDVDDPERDLKGLQEPDLALQQALVLLGGLLRGGRLNITTLSNQCTRKIPRVSLPWEPASRR